MGRTLQASLEVSKRGVMHENKSKTVDTAHSIKVLAHKIRNAASPSSMIL